MPKTLKTILTDHEFWFIMIAAFGFMADAASEGSLTILRGSTIFFMTALLVSHVIGKLKEHREKRIPFFVIAGKSDEQYRVNLNQVEDALRRHAIPVNAWERRFGLYHEDWIFRRESDLPEDAGIWRDNVLKIERKFWQLTSRIAGQKTYHFFMNAPAAISLGIGATVGRQIPFKLYQFMPGTGEEPYYPVIDINPYRDPVGMRILKTPLDVEHPESIIKPKLQVVEQSGATEVLVPIFIASHDPRGEVRRLSAENGLPIVEISLKTRDSLPRTSWIPIAREVNTVLLKLTASEKIKRLHLFLSVPFPIAFCIGYALGNFPRVSVYNFFPNKSGYFEVFKLEDLRA